MNGETHIPESLSKFDGVLYSEVVFSAAAVESGKWSGSENNDLKFWKLLKLKKKQSLQDNQRIIIK